VAEVGALFAVLAQVYADILDHFTTGSAEPPIEKFISCSLGNVNTWTFAIPVATDSEWIFAQLEARHWFYNVSATVGVAFGSVIMPASSNQVSFPVGVSPGVLADLTQAVQDAGKRTIVTAINHKGPFVVFESSEVLEPPEGGG